MGTLPTLPNWQVVWEGNGVFARLNLRIFTDKALLKSSQTEIQYTQLTETQATGKTRINLMFCASCLRVGTFIWYPPIPMGASYLRVYKKTKSKRWQTQSTIMQELSGQALNISKD